MIQSLKFIMEQFLLFKDFDKVEEESESIETLSQEMVEILLNSASYYQKKYEGELDTMNEVFPVECLSPLKL
jgi:hypothetical protein